MMTRLPVIEWPLSSNRPAGDSAAVLHLSLHQFSQSRPDTTSLPDGSTRRGLSPGHPIPPTAPWPGSPIRDASPQFAHPAPRRQVRRFSATRIPIS
jgi:hypothetical protein